MQLPYQRNVRILCAFAGATCLASNVAAQSQAPSTERPSEQQSQTAAREMEQWSQMEDELLRAEELIEGDVTNGVNPVGSVSDLVLSQDGSRVEYILYEVPYPYTFFGNEDGFTTFQGVDIFRGFGPDLEVRVPLEEDAPPAPEELTLTAEEADRRLVSRVIGERLYFSEDESRRIEDLLIDRQSGEVLQYIVETDPDALWRADRRSVPAEQIAIDDEGRINTSIDVASLDEMQEYDSGLL